MASFVKNILVTLKGIGMGAADVIPGVSGGTIAFMTGIYDELVGSISSINIQAFKLLFTGKFKEFWKHINGTFLFSVALGILISIFSLAKLMQYLLNTHPIQTWAFFFGLIVASSIFILKGISNWKGKDSFMLVFGILLGVVICTLSPTQTPDGLWFIFITGAVAICAMILPGISGSFIMLIMGKYEYIMSTIANLIDGVNFWQSAMVLGVFAVGAAVGIVSFSKFLHWLMGKYERGTILVMAGFIIGSLVKVWPWSNKADIILSQSGLLGVEQAEVLPQAAVDTFWPMVDMHIGGAILFVLIGFTLVVALEIASKKLGAPKE